MNSIRPSEDEYLSRAQVCEILGVKMKTLRDWQREKSGPPFVLLTPRTIRYPKTGLDEFLTRQTGAAS